MELPSDGSRGEKKRKQILDAATGPAWGAQSFSAVKNMAINKAMQESGKDPGFGDFGRYFSEKKRKLTEQYHKESTTSFSRSLLTGVPVPKVQAASPGKSLDQQGLENASKRLFQGVCIFVDGFTNPTHQELRFLMMNHGGVFENYFSTQRVTHIICSVLPDSKIMNPRLMSRGLPIVKPEWIVDSIKENKLLPWGSYQLERIAYSHPHQRTISSAFSGGISNHHSGANAVPAISTVPMDVEDKTNSIVDEHAEQPRMHDMGASDLQRESKLIESKSSNTLNEPEIQDVGPHTDDIIETTDFQTKEGSSEVGHEKTAEDKRPKQVSIAGRGRSFLDDPDFVQSYFKSSRLHFIGTWRNRYQSLVNSGKFGKPDQTHLALQTSSDRSAIIHIDMDCFFVSVIVRNRPALVGKPVAVCHSDSAKGTGEISSANYAARSFGIKAGMFVRTAKALCPELTIVPYDFVAYEQVADLVYSIFHKYCSTVQAVSCDEAFLDVSFHPDPVKLASKIRDEIYQATMCTASAGIAENPLLARLATKKAKPNGQFHIRPDQVKEFMAKLPVDELPGVGWTLREKLHGQGLYTCTDLLMMSKEALQRDYGAKTGIMLWSYAQGIDDREVIPAQVWTLTSAFTSALTSLDTETSFTGPGFGQFFEFWPDVKNCQERKSIGAEVNWGVRFKTPDDAQQFLVDLSNEVAARMQKVSSSGRTITLKVKRRKEGETEPVKFMGCGICDNLSRSETVGYSTNSADVLLRISRQLFASLQLDVQEVRGLGLQVSRLEASTGNPGSRQKLSALDSWLAPVTKFSPTTGSADATSEDHPNIFSPEIEAKNDTDCRQVLQQNQSTKSDVQATESSGWPTPSNFVRHHSKNREGFGRTSSSSLDLPPLSQLDRTVLEHLPDDIVEEINNATRAHEELKAKKIVQELKAKESAQEELKARERAHGEPKARDRSQEEIKSRERAQEELKARERAQEELEARERAQEKLKARERAQEEQKARETVRRQETISVRKSHQPRLFPRDHKQHKRQPQTRTRRSDNKPRNVLTNLPPKSELDPSVLEALPNDILEEINEAYLERESLRRRSGREDASRFPEAEAVQTHFDATSEEEIPVQATSTDSRFSHNNDGFQPGTSSQHVDMRGKFKILSAKTGKDFLVVLQNIMNSALSDLTGQNLASKLLSLGCFLPLDGAGDLTGLEEFIHESNKLLIRHAQVIAAKDLEQIHLLILCLKRLGGRCKFWRAVQELAVAPLKDIIDDHYGGRLGID